MEGENYLNRWDDEVYLKAVNACANKGETTRPEHLARLRNGGVFKARCSLARLCRYGWIKQVYKGTYTANTADVDRATGADDDKTDF